MVRLWRLVALVPLLVFGLFQVTSSSQDDQCRFTFTEDEVLDVTQSQDQGAKVSKDLHVSNKIQCAEECCSIEGEWCTLAVYHTQAMGDAINCFLVQCVPDGQTESVCVSTHMRHSGFILATVEHQSNTTDLPAGETLPPSPTPTSAAVSPSPSSQPNTPPPTGASPSPSPTPTAPASPNHTTSSSIVPAAATTTLLKDILTTTPSHTGTNDSTTTTTTTPVPNTTVPSTNSTTSRTLSVSSSSSNSTTSSASTPSTQSNSTLNSSSPTTATPKPSTPPTSSPFPPSGITHGASPHPSNMSTSGHVFEEDGDNATTPLPPLTPSSSSPPSSSANPQDIVNDHDSKTTSVATTALKTTPTSKTTPTLKAVTTTHGETDTTLPSEEEITTPTSESISPSTPDLMNKPNGTAENLQGVTNTIDVVHHDNVDRETVTKTGILIVALCFGIIFFLAMMVVIGKRWCEGYQRRKYSKVDYLINGIYS